MSPNFHLRSERFGGRALSRDPVFHGALRSEDSLHTRHAVVSCCWECELAVLREAFGLHLRVVIISHHRTVQMIDLWKTSDPCFQKNIENLCFWRWRRFWGKLLFPGALHNKPAL